MEVRVVSVEQRIDPGVVRLLDDVAALAERSGAFASVTRRGGMVEAAARENPEALFRIEAEADRLFVAWASPNRYLSQSIEADLMWTGDDLNDLIAEELSDQGYSGAPLGRVEHFRDEQKNFVFRSLIPAASGETRADVLVRCLLAYHAAMSQLGGMKPDGE